MHNHKLDFGIETLVLYTGKNTGKSSFLEHETDDVYDEYYGSSSVKYKNWRVVEQDALIIDDRSKCICRYLKTTADCFEEAKKPDPIVILAATHLQCWKASFKRVIVKPSRFYDISEWYKLLETTVKI